MSGRVYKIDCNKCEFTGKVKLHHKQLISCPKCKTGDVTIVRDK